MVMMVMQGEQGKGTMNFVCTTPNATRTSSSGGSPVAPGAEYQRAMQLNIPVVQQERKGGPRNRRKPGAATLRKEKRNPAGSKPTKRNQASVCSNVPRRSGSGNERGTGTSAARERAQHGNEGGTGTSVTRERARCGHEHGSGNERGTGTSVARERARHGNERGVGTSAARARARCGHERGTGTSAVWARARHGKERNTGTARYGDEHSMGTRTGTSPNGNECGTGTSAERERAWNGNGRSTRTGAARQRARQGSERGTGNGRGERARHGNGMRTGAIRERYEKGRDTATSTAGAGGGHRNRGTRNGYGNGAVRAQSRCDKAAGMGGEFCNVHVGARVRWAAAAELRLPAPNRRKNKVERSSEKNFADAGLREGEVFTDVKCMSLREARTFYERRQTKRQRSLLYACCALQPTTIWTAS
ncbi:hypothetical protein B0H16DRAFT_1456977 [Mycena metata]|uniref:Uncharacterized protein n=1 Tax=Mycena metata TaxID=1033252 RepID=A0AAD7J8G7_9AGAR|nr:hypothetical protein B0H16DRAFT_1456977 [Mycena metata]